VRDTYFRTEFPRNWDTQSQNYGKVHLYAVDFDPRVERVARFMMWVAGDGSANVFRMNSLDEREWKRDPRFLQEVADGGFDVIMTNPPFAGTIRHPQILTKYDLAYKERLVRRRTKETVKVHRDRKRRNTMTRDVLFLERCLRWLAPGGRMAIVLPQGNFNNVSAEYIRREVMRRARILAVVGLDVNTFKPHTGTKTSVLFLQKWGEDEAPDWEDWYQAIYDHEAAVDAYQRRVAMRDKLAKKPIPAELGDLKPPGDPPAPPRDYPIFFATSKRSGRDNSGQYDYLKDENGQVVMERKEVLVHDEEGAWTEVERERKKLDCDLNEIAEAFIAWGRKHNLDFFAHSPHDGRSFAEIVEGAGLTISSVPVSGLGWAMRADAEYYQPRYLVYEALFKDCPTVDALTSYILHPVEVKREYVEEGIQILLAQNIRGNRLDFSEPAYMSADLSSKLRRNLLETGDVVITRSGVNYGDTAPYLGVPAPLYASADCLVLRPTKISGEYLATFFNTHYGRELMKRGAYGTAQPHIAPTYISELRVYINRDVEREANKLLTESQKCIEKSKRLYRQAEQLLLDELGLHDLNLPKGLHSQAPLTQAWEAHRIDSEYFRPRCLGATEMIYNCGHPVHLLRELLTAPLTNGATPLGADYAGGEVVFLTAENIKELQVWPDDKRIAAEFSNSVLARSRLKPGDLLVTIKGKVGVAAVAPEFEGEWNINQDIARAQIDPSVNPYYLAVFFESELGQAQVDRLTTGAINPFLGLGNLIDFPIPIPPRDVQDKFEGITREIIEKRRQAEALLEQAKRKVEALIESEAAHG
jgi:type I restriction enzyme M protein